MPWQKLHATCTGLHIHIDVLYGLIAYGLVLTFSWMLKIECFCLHFVQEELDTEKKAKHELAEMCELLQLQVAMLA